MKKKKAFTLIELLAVILILAILALIVSPIVMSVVSSANKESAARSLEGYAEAVNTAIAQYALNNKGKMPKELSQVKEYIEAKNKENVTIKKSKIEKGTVKSITAIVGDYKCTYNQSEGASCIEASDNDLLPNIIMRSRYSEILEEMGISYDDLLSIAFDAASEDVTNKFFSYLEAKYDVSELCFKDGTQCGDGENERLLDFGTNFSNDITKLLYNFFNIDISTTEVQSIEFTSVQPSEGESIDISENQNERILLYSIPIDENVINVIIYSDEEIIMPSNSSYFFAFLQSVTNLKFNNMLDTSQVIDMSYMFSECRGLTNLDLSKFDTSNVTTMWGMFGYCRSLVTLNLSSFNTSSVTNMGSMFTSCSSLTNLDLSSFNTSNVTNMSYMFSSDTNLEHIYVVSNWNTDLVTDSSTMFKNCTKLPNFTSSKLDKTNANTSATGYLTLKTA